MLADSGSYCRPSELFFVLRLFAAVMPNCRHIYSPLSHGGVEERRMVHFLTPWRAEHALRFGMRCVSVFVPRFSHDCPDIIPSMPRCLGLCGVALIRIHCTVIFS